MFSKKGIFDPPQWIVGLHFTLCTVILIAVSSVAWAHGSSTSLWEFWLGPNSRIRSVVELTYLFTNSFLALIALYAFYASRGQYREAEQTRLASVYSGISSDYNSDAMGRSRIRLAEMHISFNKLGLSQSEFPKLLHEAIEPLRTTEGQALIYWEIMRVVFFLEHVGLLMRKNYVDARDVKLLLGSAFSYTANSFGHHIQMRRAASGNDQLFANLIESEKILRKIGPEEIAEGLRSSQDASLQP